MLTSRATIKEKLHIGKDLKGYNKGETSTATIKEKLYKDLKGYNKEEILYRQRELQRYHG